MKTPKIFLADTCPSCTNGSSAPYRVYGERGLVVAGCVDHFHTGHLVAVSESSRWHNRTEAKAIRAASKAMRSGCVTEAA